MDTGTHFAIGLGLAGLAHIDPVVADNATAATAVLIGTVLGSQAPDADGLLRFKGNAMYIKNHRGFSHSLPFMAIWSWLITFLLWLSFPGVPVLHLGAWVTAAIVLHVFTDLFNTYGTQAFRPFSDRWVSWNIIHIFDPVIFASHVLALLMWAAHTAPPAYLFSVLYMFLAFYYIWRTVVHFRLEKGLRHKDADYADNDRYNLIPTFNINAWNVIKLRQNGSYMLGELKNGKLQWIDQVSSCDHPAAEASKRHPDIAAFLYFSSHACAKVKEHAWGYEVRWFDVRYRHRKHYPFVGVLLADQQMRTLDCYVGWLNNERLGKKLRLDLLS